ncbi:hypothetical protein L1987_56023 [Smallanthus sonchifolius]|uniref:Uncharacterized protein n=1 Tax=Smallanthus sonchifolius TaxID=185202 RepID=A0ACB9ECN7_9ASTR|nr:hypothetical protein L1987_56023 [Smallanthus sonchifolius]
MWPKRSGIHHMLEQSGVYCPSDSVEQNCFYVLMIIKGLFRRYERWNPVHPTSGAFWGMGIGLGCGIGWGPGFGPEVIGYVGAGCGVGFSVGITLAGVGVGLPANRLLKVPFSAFMATRSGAVDFARSSGLLGTNGNTDGINVTGMHRWVSNFNHEQTVDKRVDFSGMSRFVSSQAKSVLDYFDELKTRVNHPR